MPKGQYERKGRLNKEIIKKFVEFMLSESISAQMNEVEQPFRLATMLYEKETGIKISETTAKNQKGKWIFINGELYRKKKNKEPVKKNVN